MKKYICLIGFCFSSVFLYAQFDEPGMLFGIGVGLGYSTHAGSYEVDEIIRIRQYPGFRAYLFEGKLGWTFTSRTQGYGIVKASPSNATISPYRFFYYGIVLAQSLGNESPFYLMGGAGYNKATLEKNLEIATGILVNIGGGSRLGNNLYLELNVHFGNMDDSEFVRPYPFRSGEVNFFMTLSYTIL